MTAVELSIILPTYNEEKLIAGSLDSLYEFLSDRPESYQIIVSDDGSQDETVEIVSTWKEETGANLLLVTSPQNHGKGHAIRQAVFKSSGQYLVFIDADLPYELAPIDQFLDALRNEYDLAVGSRALPGSLVKGVPTLRFMAGHIFSWLVQAVLFTGLPDTQCGFKGLRAKAAREIFKRLTIEGFGFDVEMLFIARKLGYPIHPIPVRMAAYRSDSRVRILSDSLRMFGDLFTIRRNHWLGKYD
ncbi:MAG: glycosyltransferase family 2 protein [Anaerolineales bacterium]|nr:glycosyltransferase family 2 protein [Anaerolineales bacterium]